MIFNFVSGINDCGNVYSIAGLYTDSYSIRVSSLVAFVLEIYFGNVKCLLCDLVSLSLACSSGALVMTQGFSWLENILSGLGLVHPMHPV